MSNRDYYNETNPVEGSTELNGKGASFRSAPMISTPGTVQKVRINGALVPLPKDKR